jgi:hypothetical protein
VGKIVSIAVEFRAEANDFIHGAMQNHLLIHA